MTSLWQPTLESATLRLRPLLQSDWAALLAAASDPRIWEQHPEPTRWQPDVFGAYFRGALESHGALLVEDPKTGQVLGCSRYTGHDPGQRFVEIGYTFLTRPYWGGACNGELKRLMLAHAFTLVDTVWFVVGETNWRSRKALQKIGARLHLASDVPLPGPRPARVFYRIDKATAG